MKNGVYWFSGPPVPLSLSAEAATTDALNATTVLLVSDVDCYFILGDDPTATADPAVCYRLPANATYHLAIPVPSWKLSAISSEAGTMQIIKTG